MTRPVHLVFVRHAEPWQRFLESLGQDKAQIIPITFDVGLASRWQREKRCFGDLWRKLDSADHAAIGQLSTQLAETWYRPFLGDLCHGQLKPADLCKRDMIPVFGWAATVQRAVARVLAEYRPQRLTLWTDLNRPLSGYINADNDIAAAVILHEAQRQGVKTSVLPYIEAKPATGSRGVERIVNGSEKVVPGRQPKDRDVLAEALDAGRSKTIALQVCNHSDYQLQLPLKEELQRRGVSVISAIYGGGTPDASAGLLRLEPFLELPWQDDGLQHAVADAWQAFVRQQSHYSGTGAELLGNPLLNFQFQFFFDNLVEGARWFEAVGQVADLIRPDLCLTGLDVIGLRRCAYEALRLRRIPTVQHQHGMICDFELHDFRSDYLFVPGERHRAEHVERGRPAEKIIVVGDPGVAAVAETPALERTMPAAPAPLMSVPAQLLAITATAVIGSDRAVIDGYRHGQAWQALADAVADRPATLLLIKPHPRYDDFTLYHDLESSGLITVVDRHRNLNGCLADADAVVLVNSTTSAAIHAMASQKPVLYILNAETVEGGEPNVDILRTSGAAVVSDLAELPGVVRRLLDDPAERRQVIDRQNDFLRAFVPFRGAAAARKMADFMTNLANSGGRPAAPPAGTCAQLARLYIATGDAATFQRGAAALSGPSRNGRDKRPGLAKELSSWLALWSWQYPDRLRGENTHIRGVQAIDAALALQPASRRRLEASAYRVEALHRQASGDIAGMRRCALRAIVRQNPLQHNLDLSKMVLASVVGEVPRPLVRWVKKLLRRGAP